MPLTRAEKRQDILEKLLLDFGEMDIDLSGEGDVVDTELLSVMNYQLAVLSYLALNVRDLIMLLNRENPDGRPPDGETPVIGQRVTPESPSQETEENPEELKGGQRGVDVTKTAVTPPGEEDKENQ